ncbi:hypothetical protein BH20ACI2_BH20ACI2_28930 [soil metagenome]
MLVLLLTLILSNFQSKCLEDGWKGIQTFKSQKVDVEAKFGKPEVDDNDYYVYTLSDEWVRVNYSTSPCTDNRYGRGEYSVKEGTVLRYWVSPKKQFKINELAFDKKKYFKVSAGDVLDSWAYVNHRDGVIIYVVTDPHRGELVDKIEYFPIDKDLEKYSCMKSKSN